MAANAAHWRDLPATFGKWTAVHARFRRWSHAGSKSEVRFRALADTPDFANMSSADKHHIESPRGMRQRAR